MVPRKYKPVIEKYHSLTIVIFNQPNNCIHSNNICQKTILENEKKKIVFLIVHITVQCLRLQLIIECHVPIVSHVNLSLIYKFFCYDLSYHMPDTTSPNNSSLAWTHSDLVHQVLFSSISLVFWVVRDGMENVLQVVLVITAYQLHPLD